MYLIPTYLIITNVLTFLPIEEKQSSTIDFYVFGCKQHWQLKTTQHQITSHQWPLIANNGWIFAFVKYA